MAEAKGVFLFMSIFEMIERDKDLREEIKQLEKLYKK